MPSKKRARALSIHDRRRRMERAKGKLLRMLPGRPASISADDLDHLLTEIAWALADYNVPKPWPKANRKLRIPGKGSSLQERRNHANLLKPKTLDEMNEMPDRQYCLRMLGQSRGAGRPQTESHRDSLIYCLAANLERCGFRNRLGLVEEIWRKTFPKSPPLSRQTIFDITRRQARSEVSRNHWQQRVMASRRATAEYERRNSATLARIAKAIPSPAQPNANGLRIRRPAN